MKELEEADREETGSENEQSAKGIGDIIKRLEEGKERYQAYAEELKESRLVANGKKAVGFTRNRR